MLKSPIWNGPKFLIFGKIPWSASPWYFDRLLIITHHLKGLSLSFQKIIIIGPTELKLWPFKDALFVVKLWCSHIVSLPGSV